MKKILLFLMVLIVFSCSSSKIMQQYSYSESQTFMPSKVLVVGLSANTNLRKAYENELVRILRSKNIKGVKSIDFFESSFTKKEQTIEDLNKIEDRLLQENYDAILLTKVVGKESRFYSTRLYYEFMKGNQTFEDYFYGNQYVYLRKKKVKEDYKVYVTETSLYCICPEKERELLWKSEIEVKEGKKSVYKFVNLLLQGLREDSILGFE